ncbi:MAG: NTP transferase domain-containing protein [Elusimicrobiota bacterium]|jgi:CTP:molybdopterin cytidylyltransferase MocA
MGPRFQAYLLAAGRGARAGGPKAWREHEGQPLLQRQLDFLKGLFPPERIAVSVQKDWLTRCSAWDPRVHWVPVDPEAPALAAVLALARVLPLDDWTFLHHVDMRVWEPGLFRDLERAAPAAQREGIEALVPVHEGRRGHPVLLSSAIKAGLLALEPARDRLDVWLRSRKVGEFSAAYACIHDNWNF